MSAIVTCPLLLSAYAQGQIHSRRAPSAIVTLAVVFLASIVVLDAGRAAAQPTTGSETQGATLEDRNAERAAAELERLARANFDAMSEGELKLVHAAPRRALIWLGPNNNIDDPANDPAHAEQWPPSRTVRAALIRWLASDAQARRYVHPSGIGFGGAVVTGQLDLSYLTLSWPLTILSSSIRDGIDFSFAHLPALDLSRDVTGVIMGDRATIDGDLLLTGGDYGATSLYRTEIDGSFDCSGAEFVSGDDPLSMVEATIKGDASFHAGFTTNGIVDLRLAHIGRGLSFNHARFVGTGENGLNAQRAQIDGTFYWVDITRTPGTMLDLSNARAASLWDDASSWPSPGRLSIDDFVYGDIMGGPTDAKSRLEWIARQPSGFRPQPYGQLAKVMRERGSDIGAIDVMIAKEQARRRVGGLGLGERIWNVLLEVTIGYGYRPMRAIWWIFFFVVLGAVLFGWGYRERTITPTESAAYDCFVRNGEPPLHYPPFNAFVYSLENFLPIVDLHQGIYWRPNPRHGSGGRLRALSGTVLRWYLWVHILAGWIITPLLAAGLTGLVRPE
jgi:hypothetical protein